MAVGIGSEDFVCVDNVSRVAGALAAGLLGNTESREHGVKDLKSPDWAIFRFPFTPLLTFFKDLRLKVFFL